MKFKLTLVAVVIFKIAISATALAQYQVSGLLDIVLRNTSTEDYTNVTYKNFSNFDMIRAFIFFDAKASDHASVFTELLIDNDKLQLYGAYVRLSRIADRSLNLNAGFIPNPVGLWGPRTYSDKNPLIGVPLAYNYRTALSSDAGLAEADDLYERRGEGYEHFGYPIIFDAWWNTGLELFGSAGKVDWSVAALAGTLSAPAMQRVKDIPQFTTQLSIHVSPMLAFTVNGFAGPYLNSMPNSSAATSPKSESDEYGSGSGPNDYLNLGSGLGIHYDYGYLEVFAEGFWTRWEHPEFGNLDAYSAYIDARYKFATQWYVAARIETIQFSKYDFGDSTGMRTWDFPVNRVEFGIGYRIDRSTTLKVVSQIVRSKDSDELDDETVAIQLTTAIH